MFDILNSRNKACKNPTQQCITPENILSIEIKVNEYIEYIKQLKWNGISVLCTNRKIGFLRLILCMKSVINLANYVFKEGMSYLLTYKLSQDHLETFFSSVRSQGGFDNNPSARRFKSAYKKLLTHVNGIIPLTGNTIPKDDTLLIRLKRTYKKKK